MKMPPVGSFKTQSLYSASKRGVKVFKQSTATGEFLWRRSQLVVSATDDGGKLGRVRSHSCVQQIPVGQACGIATGVNVSVTNAKLDWSMQIPVLLSEKERQHV